MSGGHFDLNYYAVENFAEELTREINNNSVPDRDGYAHNFSNETLAQLRQIAAMAEVLSPLMKAADYLYEGDHGEESFQKIVAKAMPKSEIIIGLLGGDVTSVWCDRPATVELEDHDQTVSSNKDLIRVY